MSFLLGDRLKEVDALKRKPPELVVSFWPCSESAEAFLFIFYPCVMCRGIVIAFLRRNPVWDNRGLLSLNCRHEKLHFPRGKPWPRFWPQQSPDFSDPKYPLVVNSSVEHEHTGSVDLRLHDAERLGPSARAVAGRSAGGPTYLKRQNLDRWML